MDWNHPFLHRCPLFDSIDKRELGTLLTCLGAVRRSYRRYAYVWMTGQPVASMGILLSGSVHLLQEDFWGNCTIINHLVPGELLGEAFACMGTPHLPISVLATTRTDILWLNYRRVITTCRTTCRFHSRLVQNMLEILARKNVQLMQKMEIMARRSTREKVMAYLSGQAQKIGKTTFEIPFNRQEMADYLSVDRSALSKELCAMRDSGWLLFRKNRFELKLCAKNESVTQQ